MAITYSSVNIPKRLVGARVTDSLIRMRGLLVAGGGEYKDSFESLRPAFDPSVLADCEAMANRMHTTSLSMVVVVGIGGSSLGTKAIIDALCGRVERSGSLSIQFLESIDPQNVARLCEFCKLTKHADEILINVVSKAGATTETVANFSLLADALAHISGWEKRIVVTTTQGSGLDVSARKLGYATLYLDKLQSGRYSVFSAVGVFPLLIAGFPVREILEGAKEAVLALGTPADPTRRMAEDVLGAMHGGAHMIDFFFFNPELESLGKWMRQLYAESLGKERDRSGREVRVGITPTVTIGSTDLHSMVQLYFGGPRDRMTLLVPPLAPLHDRPLGTHPFLSLVPGLSRHTEHQVNCTIYAGVHSAFRDHRLMYAEAKFAGLTPHMLGAFMQWQMLTVAAIAEGLDICAFDQPNVEDYKKVTRALLVR